MPLVPQKRGSQQHTESRTSPLNVNAEDLRYLLAVARTGRMVAAAAALGIDHSTVGRRIRRLEGELGVKLLVRMPDGWRLSETGKAIAARAGDIESIVQDVRAIASGEANVLRGTVRIAAPDGFGVAFVAPALSRLRRKHPGIAAELVTSSRPVSPRGTGFDVSINIGAPPSGRAASETLTRYTLGLFASDAYLAQHGVVQTEDDLRDHPLIFYIDALLSVEELDLMRSFSEARIGLGSTNVLAQVAATRAGGGIGLLPHFLVAESPELVPVLPDVVRFDLEFSLSLRQERRTSAAVAAVCDAIRAEVSSRRSDLVAP